MSALSENVHLNEEELESLITADDPEDPEKEDNFHDPHSTPLKTDRNDQ